MNSAIYVDNAKYGSNEKIAPAKLFSLLAK